MLSPWYCMGQDMLTMLQTNVAAVMEFTRAFAPPMVARNQGHIINISSVAGHEAYGGADSALQIEKQSETDSGTGTPQV